MWLKHLLASLGVRENCKNGGPGHGMITEISAECTSNEIDSMATL
jgi:N-acetylglutamate synthase-like GNAT family acetyltransferase